MNEYYVYVYLDCSKLFHQYIGSYFFQYEPMYVGKGFGQRIQAHLRPSILYSGDTYFHRHLQKLKENKTPISFMKVAENLSETQAFEIEKFLISSIGRKCTDQGPLYNITEGGEGTSGRVSPMKGKSHSETSKQKISENSKRLKPMLGKHHTLEEKENLSRKLKGRKKKPFSAEHIENLKKSHLGKKQSSEVRRKMSKAHTKKIKCVDTGQIFESATEAAVLHQTSPTNIRTACRTAVKAVGYYWTYYKEKEEDGSS